MSFAQVVLLIIVAFICYVFLFGMILNILGTLHRIETKIDIMQKKSRDYPSTQSGHIGHKA